MKVNIVKLVTAIIICQLAGVFGSIFTVTSIDSWYSTLEKPFFTPPNYVFGPVWITLYTLMGISLYLVWQKGFRNTKNILAVKIFGFQLLLNAIWSLLFFGLQKPFYSFIEIVILWIAILVTIIKFYKISKKAGILLIPYLIWVTIATALNLGVYLLN